LLGLVLYAIVDESITGPVNAVSPNPVANADFTATLGKVLSRPTIFSIPEFIIKLPLGEELANTAILSSSRVIPERLIKMGYLSSIFGICITTYPWKGYLILGNVKNTF
jgi:uncharacterized protein